MFHSTGMPFGLLRPMKEWKPVNRMQPPSRIHSLPVTFASRRISGIENSEACPNAAIVSAKRDGRRSSGKFVNRLRLRNFGKNGPLFIMNMITDGKWRFHFETAAQIQMNDQVSFAPEIQRPFAAASVMQPSTTQ
jgi:hypothetical protein